MLPTFFGSIAEAATGIRIPREDTSRHEKQQMLVHGVYRNTDETSNRVSLTGVKFSRWKSSRADQSYGQ